RNVGVVAEAFARVDVGDVHFDRRHVHAEDRVEDGDGRGGVAGGIDDDAERLFASGLVNPVDDGAFVVRLPELDGDAEPAAGVAAQLFHVRQGRAAVFLRLAGAEQIEVRAVENVDGLGHGAVLAQIRA